MLVKFFATEDFQERLRMAEGKTNLRRENSAPNKVLFLHSVLKIIRENAVQFDENCQTNIEWIGSSFAGSLGNYINTNTSVFEVDDVYSCIYRFIIEFDLSVQNDLSMELRKFKEFTEHNLNLFNEHAKSQMTFALVAMPIAIMKTLLGSDVLRNVRHLDEYTEQIEKKISGWNGELSIYEQKTIALKESLSNYSAGFNFVGLYDGFDQLSKEKAAELAAHRKWLLLFGLLAILPVTAEFLLLSWNLDRIVEMKWALLIAAIPALPITILFIYFFRIVLRSFDGTKSQILQIELRKTLCKFIQHYAEYSKTLKANNIDSLTKFENIIFSGLVSSDEKLPTTFDGLEHITNMMKAFQK